jgi:hypothetical protein
MALRMADTYTIAAAARLCHCDRRTLQRAIRRGTLHLDANHCLSREDLLLAGYLVADTPLAPPQAPPQDLPLAAPLAPPLLPLLERLTTALEGIWHELQRLQPAAPAPQAMPLSTPQAAPQPPPQPRRQAPTPAPPAPTPQGPSGAQAGRPGRCASRFSPCSRPIPRGYAPKSCGSISRRSTPSATPCRAC